MTASAFAETSPPVHTPGVVDKCILSADEFSSGEFPVEFERLVVARTVST